MPRGHPLENLLREVPDFRDEAALADALLNPKDRAYSVPEVFDLLQAAADELPRLGASFVLPGTGDRRYEDLWRGLARRFPEVVAAHIGFDKRLARTWSKGARISS